MTGAIVLLIVGLLLYFIPSFVAQSRRHHNTGAILALNIFLGWTFLGWVAALVWALTATKQVA
ncbi:superinfection immunity protein [Caballeronia sp. NCTM5]|uniref:superinfection immunity protein n=1 Tax=Caballeronia sp. NCTM5 TaxID=2921755 RepID=UPI002028D1CC|nr:superinfection immunity protein [Caballeronia sp. NCTM5]